MSNNTLLKQEKVIELNDRRRRARKGPSFPSRKGERLVEGLTKAELVKKYESKVRFIAAKLAGNLPVSVDLEDLVSVGFIGLMDAADKFREARGAKFGTYAEFRIRGSILDELRNQDWVPHCARGKAKEIERASSKLERQNGCVPSESEISAAMGVSQQRFQKLKERVGSLTLVSIEDHEPFHQMPDMSENSNPLLNAIRNDAKSYLENLFRELVEEERIVLSCYYFRGLNLKEISEILSLTESRISQIHTKAIFRLKERLRQEAPSAQAMFTMLLEAS